jgi:rhodanese-related sulfurtransferase/glyoxylase-like metal-dependent hydrolase (beta-lactamase superfamily II)
VIFTQYYLECLSHASYLIGDESTGRAVVVDPQRDVSQYLDDAETDGLRIERVIETHIHADFLSGHLELAARTGAVVSYGKPADVAFPIEPLEHGQRLLLGTVALEILATPGHTPESISIVVYEHEDDATPYGVLTGDTLFIGDVGRPDLLAAAGHSAEDLARQLYHSVHEQLLTLPDETRVFPAHGAGSACGKQLSTERQSTIGEQRSTNYALQPMTEDEFVNAVTDGQPLRPAYFSFDAQANREVHSLLAENEPLAKLGVDQVLSRAAAGAVLLDGRAPADFAHGHLRGALNVGLDGRFAEYVGDVVAPDCDIVLVGDPATAAEARTRLARIGFDGVVGYLADPASAAATAAHRFEPSSRVTIEQLAEARGNTPELQLVDVRNPGETAHGTIRGAFELPLPALIRLLPALDPTRPTAVYCAGGYRSSIAASVLRAHGFVDVSDVLGGFGAWRAAGLPVADHADPEPAGHDAGEHGSRKKGTTVMPNAPVPEVDAAEGRRRVEGGALLLDVREPDEWAAGHAPDARAIPLGQVQARLDELPTDRPIVAICRSGGRSASVTEALTAWGFDAVNLAGGMRAWAAAGYPVVTDDGGPGAVI